MRLSRALTVVSTRRASGCEQQKFTARDRRRTGWKEKGKNELEEEVEETAFGFQEELKDKEKEIELNHEVFSFKEILNHIFTTLDKPARFINIPSFFAIIQGKLMEKLPNPLFTYDQFLSLSHDSISEGSEKLVTQIIEKDLSNMKTITTIYLDKFLDRV